MDLKAAVKAEAARLGFLFSGVTLPDPPAHFAEYQEWLADGMHAEMAYLATERALQRRADPRQILPEVRSILCLALPYTFRKETLIKDERSHPIEEGAPLGRVAAYAWGKDYHESIPPRLERLAAFATQQLNRPIRWLGYTDTGPLLERELAQRAGLGWVGRNTCLIHPRYGSAFFLAELLWDVDLEPDAPLVVDYCGGCRRCVEACPTGCLLPGRRLNARRCISYLTIEHKGLIPADLRAMLGDWVFGCDICQQVCPWNVRFAPPQGDAALEPTVQQSTPSLLDDLLLSPQDFNRKFKHTPIQRTRRRGYLRNITAALANTGDPAVIPALTACLQSEPEALVRVHAAWSLGQFSQPSARRALENASQTETAPQVLQEIQAALRNC